MLGFNRLGQLGRLGNQMFQYAALRGIAHQHSIEFCIPPSDFSNEWTTHQLFETFKLEGLPRTNVKLLDRGHAPEVQERFFHFHYHLLMACPDHTSLHGYFQSERWFTDIEADIRRDFTFLDSITADCAEIISDFKDPICLHVRRTDYITNSANHPPLQLEYYQRALSHFDTSRQVVVFSDDAAWCRQQSLFQGSRFYFPGCTDNRYDLYLMTQCKDYIIANSSFSWWGAWLSTNTHKKVVAPIQWFGTHGYTATHDTKDLIPSSWLRI